MKTLQDWLILSRLLIAGNSCVFGAVFLLVIYYMSILLDNLHIVIGKLEYEVIITSNNLTHLESLIDVIVKIKVLCTLVHKKLGLHHWLYLLTYSVHKIHIWVVIEKLKNQNEICSSKSYYISKFIAFA